MSIFEFSNRNRTGTGSRISILIADLEFWRLVDDSEKKICQIQASWKFTIFDRFLTSNISKPEGAIKKLTAYLFSGCFLATQWKKNRVKILKDDWDNRQNRQNTKIDLVIDLWPRSKFDLISNELDTVPELTIWLS